MSEGPFGPEWHAEYRDYRHRVALYHFERAWDGIKRIEVTKAVDPNYKEGGWAEPSMIISPKEAQQLMDELWRMGIRPAGADSSANHLTALTSHLEDMRELVFGHIVVPKPGEGVGPLVSVVKSRP